MTPEQRRLWILTGAHKAKKKRPRQEGDDFDLLGFAFIIAVLLIIVFAAIAGHST